VKIQGEIQIEEEYEDKFTKDSNGKTILHINSGTIELNDNKLIVLAD
jgi:F-type H+-transporting ATPase subunit epsilon